MQSEDNTILLHKKAIYAIVKCKKCNDISKTRIENTNMTCKKCGTKEVPGKIICEETLSSFIPIILKKLLYKNEVYIIAAESEEKDYFYLIKFLKDCTLGITFEEYKGTMPISINYCKHCATCQNCLECNCGQHYTKNKNRCPKCKKKDAKPSLIKQRVPDKLGRLVCPFCGSQNVKKTYYGNKLNKCPACGSSESTPAVKQDAYICKVSRTIWNRVQEKEGEQA